jgi:hypothetical protein
MSSCTPETAEPTITWEGNLSQYHSPSDGDYAHSIDLVIAAEAGISEFTIWKHVCRATDTTSTTVDGPTGFADLLTYDYTLDIAIPAADFTDGVTKIIYEFEVTDKELRTVTEEFTIFVDEAYNVTFIVKDGLDNVLADAIVTFGDSTYLANNYALGYYVPATYAYTVEKAGYTSVNVTDFVLESDTTVTVVLQQNIAAEWSAEIPLALYGQTAWATYNSVAVTNYFSNVIGVAFNYTDASTVRIEDTDHAGGAIGCDGWVVVTDITGLTTQASLVNAYNGGTVVHTMDLPYDQHKAYAPVYFISKMGSNYLLVYYVAGHRDGTTGNVVVFKYKQ